MTAKSIDERIELPRELAFEAAVWLYAMSELFAAAEMTTPSVLEGENFTWVNIAEKLAYEIAGLTSEDDLDEDKIDQHPVMVEWAARANEHAAALADASSAAAENGQYPLTEEGSTYTAKGFRLLARKLSLEAAAIRQTGTMHPMVASGGTV